MRRPPTSDDIERMVEHSLGTVCQHDVACLVQEIDRLAGQLSDCWLLLDVIARDANLRTPRELATELLRRQQTPGWKE